MNINYINEEIEKAKIRIRDLENLKKAKKEDQRNLAVLQSKTESCFDRRSDIK